MSQRRALSHKQANGAFRKGSKTHPRNFATAVRGGYRI